MTKKSFFQTRTAEQIVSLEPKQVYKARGLVDKILALKEDKALELRFPLMPFKFIKPSRNQARSSRLNYKHGHYIPLSQPNTREEALRRNEIPLGIRAKDLERLTSIREEEIFCLGYSFRPVQGNDRRQRKVPFVWSTEGVKLFSYAEQNNPIEVQAYADARKVKYEGAEIICKVPSRTEKKPRYSIKLCHVPIEGSTERRSVPWSLKSESQIIPEHDLYNIRYTTETARESSDIFTFYPHDIAAYIAVIKHYNAEHNLTPLEMSPLAIVSKLETEFYEKLNNNIVIYDPTLQNKENKKLRNLHIDEKSILIARSIGVLGHEATMYWNPERDGKLKDYFTKSS